MSWWVIGAIAAGAYGFKALGLFGLSRIEFSGPLAGVVQFLPAAMFAGLTVQQVLSHGSTDVTVTRAIGVAAGALAVWRKVPLPLVIVISAGVAAAARAIA